MHQRFCKVQYVYEIYTIPTLDKSFCRGTHTLSLSFSLFLSLSRFLAHSLTFNVLVNIFFSSPLLSLMFSKKLIFVSSSSHQQNIKCRSASPQNIFLVTTFAILSTPDFKSRPIATYLQHVGHIQSIAIKVFKRHSGENQTH